MSNIRLWALVGMAAVLVVMTSGQDYGDFDSDDVASMLKRMAMPGCKGKKLQGEKCHHIKDHDKCCGYMGCFTRMEGAPCTKGGDCVCRPYNPMHMFVR
ncbi:uncharacterized protein LOC144885999 isoform X2 [Branchiostoma floridae x Branchiostoma japonicum]